MPLRMWILEDEMNFEQSPADDLQVSLSYLSEEQREIFEERAAIMEYDGGLTREEAEKQAMAALRQSVGVNNKPIEKQIKQDMEN